MEKTYFITKEQYQAVKAAWTTRYNHTAWEIVIYNILRSKPIRNGFVERGRNIQGDSPWYAFKLALQGARQACSTKNPWEKDRGTRNHFAVIHADERIAASQTAFRNTFGIDMPEGIMDLLKDE